MKNSNDNLKEKAIKQEKTVVKKELESVSGGETPTNFGHYKVNWDICRGNITGAGLPCTRECIRLVCCQSLHWDHRKEYNKPYIDITCNNCGDCANICPLKAIYWTLV